MRVRIDTEKCTGHGRCYMLAQVLFEDNDQGYGKVIGEGLVTADTAEDAIQAEIGCPESAVVFDRDEASRPML
jgi:ferredoxin